jgi:hypothetical protein
MRSIDKKTFMAFMICPKMAAFINNKTTGTDIMDLEANKIHEAQFKESAYEMICRLESDEGTKVNRNKIYKTQEGLEILCDIVINRKEENILVELACTNDLHDGPEFMWLVYKYYFLNLAQANLSKVYLVKLDPKYIEGKSPKEELLFPIDVTKKLKQHLYKVPKMIRDFISLENSDILPDVHKGVRCLEPNVCPYKELCWKDSLPTEETIFEIHGMAAHTMFVHYWDEIHKFEDIPKKKLDFRQSVQVRYALKEQDKKPKRIKKDKIQNWINGVNFQKKVHFMYIGNIYPAIPITNGSKVFSRLPFQFSIDTMYPDRDNYNHFDFLADISSPLGMDKQFINRLFEWISLNDKEGSIVVYDKVRATKCLKKLSDWNPDKKNRIDNFVNRFVDLQDIFYNCWYYQPDFKGSYKLLEIAPKFLPVNTFLNFPIKNSREAGDLFLNSYYRKSRQYNNSSELLIRYSRLNTYCLMEVVKFLLNLTQS